MNRRLVLWLLLGFVGSLAAVATAALAPNSTPAVLLWLLLILWAMATAVVFFLYLWRWLTYRVSVRLVISYLLLGVTPFLVSAGLAGFALYLAMGQYTSVRYASEMERLEADLLRDCREIMAALRADGRERAADLFREAIERPRHLAPRVLWTAELDGLLLDGPAAEDLPELRWVTGETTALVREDEAAYLLVASRGDQAPNLVAAVVPLDVEMARSVMDVTWFDAFFSTLDEDQLDAVESPQLEVGAKAGEESTISFNRKDIPVGQLWRPWPEGDRGMLHKPWIYWFRLKVDVRRLDSGDSGPPVVTLLRTSPVNVWRDFTRSRYELGATLWGVLVALALFFLAVYAVALAVAGTMIVSISRSTSRLSKGAAAIEAGRLDHRIPVKRHDQLGDLAGSFNRMAESVQGMLADVAEKERLAKELELAREIQESLLPDRHLRHGGLSVHAIFRPATEVGGDYFDIFPLGEGRLLVVVGDVAGHGLHAGLLMASLKSTVAALVHEGYSGGELVERVNSLLLDSRSGPTMATLSAVEINEAEGTLEIANAGHPPAYLIRDGRAEELMASSLPLGSALGRPAFIERPFPPGARILLYSDGLVEATDHEGEPFSYERLAEVVEAGAALSGGELEASILAALDRITGGAAPADDLTLLVVERGGSLDQPVS